MSKRNKKKTKNRQMHVARRKEATHRKREAQEELQTLGLSLEHDTLSLGLIFEDLSIAQATFFGINQINELCRKYAGLNIQLFIQHASQACIQPLCPVDNVTTLLSWTHPLIATSITTCLDALTSQSSLIYHYVFDVDFDTEYDLSTTDILRTFCDSRVRVATRHQSYRQLLEQEFDIQICDTIITDFEMIKLIQLITREMQHAQTAFENV